MSTRLVIVGGFLGAGKTTLLLTAAQRLTAQGYRVGLLTNDQGADLVDTALGDQAAIPVTEVAGGCFCCRFPDLLAGLQRLQAVATPDLVLLEPVGSCTDLVATVLRPLLQFHGDQYQLAPLTILLDSTRDLTDFPPDVHYLYQQQLSEAELLLLTKIDQLSPVQADAQLRALQATYPQARLLAASAHTGVGIAEWLSIVLGQSSRNPAALVIDYNRYADAEAALGWLNVKGLVRADQPFSAQGWTDNLLATLTHAFTVQAAPIAHIKTLVTTPQGQFKASVTQAQAPITWDLATGDATTQRLEFILNVRVNANPALLEQVVMQTVAAIQPDAGARYYFDHFECFSPLPPRPTHRL
ncbi:MAG: cobalamin biosynthesis protein [Caldilinea sp. CFX5]|nr:cobalamin biosynthesis protein [Caldilinea sp. CFX5]